MTCTKIECYYSGNDKHFERYEDIKEECNIVYIDCDKSENKELFLENALRKQNLPAYIFYKSEYSRDDKQWRIYYGYYLTKREIKWQANRV